MKFTLEDKADSVWPPARIERPMGDASDLRGPNGVFPAWMQKMVSKLDLARTAFSGMVGRVALRSLRDYVPRRGGKGGPRAIWALVRWLQILPPITPRAMARLTLEFSLTHAPLLGVWQLSHSVDEISRYCLQGNLAKT